MTNRVIGNMQNPIDFSLWPAIWQVSQLFFWILLATLSILLLVKIHYSAWKLKLYMPIIAFISLAFSYFVKSHTAIDPATRFFIFLYPVAVGLFFKHALKGRFKSPVYFCAPAVVVIFLLFMYPLAFEIYLSLHRLNLSTLSSWISTGQIQWVGLENFSQVFTADSEIRESFWAITLRTLLWTGINVFFHVLLGTLFAMLLNRKIRFVPVYRTLLIIPWAIPQLIAVLAWRGEFHSSFGYVNRVLGLLGLPPQEWWTDPTALFASICIVNIWLGIPFMMVVALGALQSINKSYYEAASMDGASSLQKFIHITLPLLKPVMLPSIILGSIWTFNNVNVVYLMTSQKGGSEGADILVSDLYKQAFTFNRYSFSAAYAIVIFIMLALFSALWIKSTRLAKDPLA